MRLINTSTGLFEEFIGRNIPKYAILSHTWGEEEISFKAMTSEQSYRNLKGYKKIKMTRDMASRVGYSYAWVDTCCIDKSSSAELTEAINSMYRWYQRSEVCFVFLSDLDPSASLEIALPRCRWFTRGWTLQELIAPRNILFFDLEWNCRGSKMDMIANLSKITGINEDILYGTGSLSSMSVAQKMSWAAHRETTRIEDTAYCLLGIFGVNMPLLYGEEGKAFRRLQEEIIKSTPDFSILAWVLPSNTDETPKSKHSTNRELCGVLAESPSCFAASGSFSKSAREDPHDFSFSNSGIKIQGQIDLEEIPGKQAYRLRKCGADQFLREDPWSLPKTIGQLQAMAPRVSYLLMELPEVQFGTGAQPLSRRRVFARTRPHALQIQRPRELAMHSARPQANFDDEDQVFFSLCTNNRWDGAVVKLITWFRGPWGESLEFQSIFIALGWSSLDVDKMQCTLIDNAMNSVVCQELESFSLKWGKLSGKQILNMMACYEIPKASAAIFEIPGTKTTGVVSFTPVLVSDTSIYPEKFWRVEFSYRVYGAEDIPQIDRGEWKITN